MEVMIGKTNKFNFINYDYKTKPLDETEYYTIKELTIEEIEEIEKATFKQVQEILNNYL